MSNVTIERCSVSCLVADMVGLVKNNLVQPFKIGGIYSLKLEALTVQNWRYILLFKTRVEAHTV